MEVIGHLFDPAFAKQAYIVALGVNDISQVLAGEGTEYLYTYAHVKLYTYKPPKSKQHYVVVVEPA